jgi:hypothetical protein
MLSERLRVPLGAELMQKLGRAFDIGEEEGDGAGRKIAPHDVRDHATDPEARLACGVPDYEFATMRAQVAMPPFSSSPVVES